MPLSIYLNDGKLKNNIGEYSHKKLFLEKSAQVLSQTALNFPSMWNGNDLWLDIWNQAQVGFYQVTYLKTYLALQYKLENGILDNGIKLEYGIQMRATEIFTT